MGRLTTIAPHLHPLEPRSSCTKLPQSVDSGHPMALTAGTLVPLLTLPLLASIHSTKSWRTLLRHGQILSRHRSNASTVVCRRRHTGHSKPPSGAQKSASSYPLCPAWRRPTQRHQTTRLDFCQHRSKTERPKQNCQERLGICHLRPRQKQNAHKCLGTCHLHSAKPTGLNRLEGTAASSGGVPTSSEGGSTRYQSRCQSLYGRPASTTRPHASLSNAFAKLPEPSLTSSQPCSHCHWTHLPATHQPEPTRRQLSPRSNHWPVPRIPPTLSGPHQRQMNPWLCQRNWSPGPRRRHSYAHRYGHNSFHPTCTSTV
jgi:hypothetical protein